MTDDVWTIKAALEWTQGYLARKGDENPRLSAEWLLAEATGLRRVELYVNFERPLSMEERDILRGYVSRRGAGEPLQYITGEVAFRHIAVKVRPGVLIPRPETEVLVSEALSLLPPAGRRVARDSQIGAWEGDLLRAAEAAVGESGDGSDAFSQVASALEEAGGFSSEGAEASGDSGAETLFVADLCTGSGCIAVSLTKNLEEAEVVSWDVSEKALQVAERNCRRNGVRVTLEQRDVLLASPAGEQFDVIVSNPPYITEKEKANMSANVLEWEPELALFVPDDSPLLFYRKIAELGRDMLGSGGRLYFEINQEYGRETVDMLAGLGYKNIELRKDLFQNDRMIKAEK